MTIVDTPNEISYCKVMIGTKRERDVQEELVAPKKQCFGLEKQLPFHGSLKVTSKDGKSEVTDSFSTYPVRIVQQDNWLPHANLSVLGFGGGVVNDERVGLNLNIAENATASVKTIGPKKIYQSTDGRKCSQEIHSVIEKNALLVISPDPIACYEGSTYNATHEYIVQQDASLVVVDWFTSGRQNKNEFWQFDTFENRLRIFSDEGDRCLFFEDQIIQNNPENRVNIFNQSVKDFDHVQICGTMLLYGPRTLEIRCLLKDLQTRPSFQEKCGLKQMPFHVMTMSEELMVIKFTSSSQQYGYELLVELLRPLRSELNGYIPYEEHIHYDQSYPTTVNSLSSSTNTFQTIQDSRSVVIV